MKKLSFIIFLFLFQKSFAEIDFNWKIASLAKSDNCKTLTYLKNQGNFNEINQDHLRLMTKCTIDIVEEKGF